MTFINRITNTFTLNLIDNTSYHSILHISNSLYILIREFSSAFFKEPNTSITNITLLFIETLLYKVYKSLSSNKLLKEWLIFSNILYILIKVEDIIS
jgi:hypothetical protein